MQTAQKNFHKKLLGLVGEKNAEKFLKENGYSVLEKNYKTHVGEADIIAKYGDTIVFVEVKTRTSDDFGLPCEAVNYQKQSKYRKIATEYLLKKGWTDKESRFDVIEVENGKINHIICAF